MTQSQKNIWIQIRAELIIDWHNIHNPGKFNGGFSCLAAKEIAEHQLDYDLINGELRISLEDMLLKSNEECLEILKQKDLDKIKQILKSEHDVK